MVLVVLNIGEVCRLLDSRLGKGRKGDYQIHCGNSVTIQEHSKERGPRKFQALRESLNKQNEMLGPSHRTPYKHMVFV